jgi:sarcosine oxidase subunit gamma
VADLIAKSPLDGWTFGAGSVTAREYVPSRVTSIQPLKGQRPRLPKPGQWEAKGDGRILWTGLDEWFAVDCAPSKTGMQTDQTDGWVWVEITGDDAADVLARLTPLDPKTLSFGQTARSDVAHMAAILYGLEAGAGIAVMRSFARSLQHAVTEAMQSVATQRANTH